MSNVVGEWKANRRDPRYTIAAPVRFRTDQDEWRDGTTVNICSHGLLIRTRRPPSPPSALELQVALTGTTSGAHVACSGRVLRTEPGGEVDEMLVAVTIDRFELRPASRHTPGVTGA